MAFGPDWPSVLFLYNGFLHFEMVEDKIERRIFCDMLKLYEIQICVRKHNHGHSFKYHLCLFLFCGSRVE